MSPKHPLQPMPAVDAPADETALSEPMRTAPAATSTPPPAPGHWKVEKSSDPKEAVRKFGLVLALGFLAVSLVIAYYSANSILSIWFEYQYTPIVRLVMALGIAGLCVWILFRLTQKR